MSQPYLPYRPDDARYERIGYRRSGRSGLLLPLLSLGLWHNFGDDTPTRQQQEILHTAFDHGITHFDLANNYGTPYGSAESNFGRLLKRDLAAYRDELVISTKAGWDMWSGPYGQGGGSRKYLLASLDQSLARLGLDYVDIFYSHRYDEQTPLEETASALASAVQQGKALYVGISSGYDVEKTREISRLLAEWKVPLLIHQPVYNLLNRDLEQQGLLDEAERLGTGVIVFSPLAQGLLSGKYLNGIPQDSRAGRGSRFLTGEQIAAVQHQRISRFNEVAQRRGQTLAQLALAWTLRDPRITSALVGVSSAQQLRENLVALERLAFSTEELAALA